MPPATGVTFSVLIATKDRPDDLIPCLRSILAQTHGSFEVIVVDQSRSAETEDAIHREIGVDSKLRHRRSDQTGKSAALNELVAMARGGIFAFTDDDTEAPPDWLCQIERAFAAAPDAGILFGQVMPGEVSPAVKDPYVPCFRFHEKRYLKFREISGMGANMAMRREVAEQVGAFDILMGPGAPMAASEEGDFVYRAMIAGYRVLHDPSVTLVHRASRPGSEWNRVLHAYGLGDAAFAMKHLRCRDWSMLSRIARHVGYYAARLCYRILCRRAHQEEHYLRGYWRGLRLGLQHGIDRRRRLYVAPDQARMLGYAPQSEESAASALRRTSAERREPPTVRGDQSREGQ